MILLPSLATQIEVAAAEAPGAAQAEERRKHATLTLGFRVTTKAETKASSKGKSKSLPGVSMILPMPPMPLECQE